MTNIDEIRRPAAFLSELPDDKVPNYLYPLMMAARMLGNFAIYDDPALDKARALIIIELAKEELEHAEQRCRRR